MAPDTPIMNAEVDSFTILQLSSLALDRSYGHTVSDTQAEDMTVTTCTSGLSYENSLSSRSNLSGLSGWGSAVSRKSYACLRTLEEESRKADLQRQQQQQLQQRHCLHRQYQQNYQQVPRRPIEQPQYVGEAWGYFVDTPDH